MDETKDILDLIDLTIIGFTTVQHQPPEPPAPLPKLGALPLLKDGYRIAGEARNLADAIRSAAKAVRSVVTCHA
jgi:hypothetical protein